MSSPDIEIYLRDTPADTIISWLKERFPQSDEPAKSTAKRQWQITLLHGDHSLPVLIIENANPGFTSLWIDSGNTPWADDIACAREAHAALGKEIRATPGSWQEGDDPDLWWHINASGEGLIQWPD